MNNLICRCCGNARDPTTGCTNGYCAECHAQHCSGRRTMGASTAMRNCKHGASNSKDCRECRAEGLI